MAVDDVERLAVGRQRQPVGPLDLGLREDPRDLAVGVDPVDGLGVHLQRRAVVAVERVGEPDAAPGVGARRRWGCCTACPRSARSGPRPRPSPGRCGRCGGGRPGPCSAPSQLISRPSASKVLPLVRPLSARKTETRARRGHPVDPVAEDVAEEQVARRRRRRAPPAGRRGPRPWWRPPGRAGRPAAGPWPGRPGPGRVRRPGRRPARPRAGPATTASAWGSLLSAPATRGLLRPLCTPAPVGSSGRAGSTRVVPGPASRWHNQAPSSVLEAESGRSGERRARPGPRRLPGESTSEEVRMAGRSSRNVGAVVLVAVAAVGMCRMRAGGAEGEAGAGPAQVEVRGVYGGVPTQILDRGQSLADYGINAVWVGSGGLTREGVALLKRQGAKVFAEFNTMHDAAYLKDHPDAAPVGTDGKPCPPPDGWQGVCPTHPGYREARMEAFRQGPRATSRSTASGSTTTTPTRAGSRPSRTCPTPASAPAAWPGSSGRRASTCPTAPPRSWPAAARAAQGGVGRAGGAGCSPTGSASSARSATRSAPARCWGRSTAPGRRTSAAGRCGRSWRST